MSVCFQYVLVSPVTENCCITLHNVAYSVGLFTLFSSHDCSCPLAPRKSFDILARYKSDYYYYYYYSHNKSTVSMESAAVCGSSD